MGLFFHCRGEGRKGNNRVVVVFLFWICINNFGHIFSPDRDFLSLLPAPQWPFFYLSYCPSVLSFIIVKEIQIVWDKIQLIQISILNLNCWTGLLPSCLCTRADPHPEITKQITVFLYFLLQQLLIPHTKNIVTCLKRFVSFKFSSWKLCTESKLAVLDPSLVDEKRLTHPEDSLDEIIIPAEASLLSIGYLGLFGCDAELLCG